MGKILNKKKENIVHTIIWLLLFLMPIATMYVRVANNSHETFDWIAVAHVWRMLSIYFGIFLLHNFFIAPLIVLQKRKRFYFACVAALTVLFITVAILTRPPRRSPRLAGTQTELTQQQNQTQETIRPCRTHRLAIPAEPVSRRPFLLWQVDIISVIILLLTLGMNLAVKFFFKTNEDEKQLQELKRKNLEQQLEYLKYQINPHFFMNTLNNIHALVDIAPDKAKSSIIVLSKMMRYILYEGNNTFIPLQKEADFISNYIRLMQMRFTDKLKISVSLPTPPIQGKIPPLLLITFVENAFKHGVSYQQENHIDIALKTDGQRLCFSCINNKGTESTNEKGGVGLASVRKRLELIYHEDYQLNIDDTGNEYSVRLNLPLTDEKPSAEQ
ncbi:sensor histidine kinase [Prevotella dentasini]|uniref:sensor histidine kinase n=1 Tax=Prevotella dentasini TaxID=589537 RepID=UPI00046833A1|nr:histidine kinase [Prevotella dentasini]